MKTILGVFAIIGLFLFAGTYDHAEIVVAHMPHTAHMEISDKLGRDASVIEVANEYISNRAYYDSLK